MESEVEQNIDLAALPIIL